MGRQLQQEIAGGSSGHTKKAEKQPARGNKWLLRKTLDSNAPLNLMIQSKLLDLYVKANDSTLWRISDRWLGADLFESEGNICYFSSLPYHEPADTLFKTIGDTLSVRLEQHFTQLHISSQIYEENGKVYYTGCSLGISN